MLIRYGFHIEIEVTQRTPVVTVLDVHPDRRSDIRSERPFSIAPAMPVTSYQDGYGNLCQRFVAEPGVTALRCAGVVEDSGLPDAVEAGAPQLRVEELPDELLVFLLASRYCDADLLADFAWRQFGAVRAGWSRVQAICDFVHDHLLFGYDHASATRTASQAFQDKVGVCRDFAHLAVALCRCLNIPARYCNGYLGDIGIPPVPLPMDFNAWFEVYLGGRWHTFDARHNTPRIGRILISRGRDATDVAMINSFGPHSLGRFDVVTEEVSDYALAAE